MSTRLQEAERAAEHAAPPIQRTSLARRLGFDRFGALYVLAAIVLVFSVWAPETFPTFDTVKQIVNNYAITALIALALVIPLSTGVFDISGAYTMTLTGVLATWLIVRADMAVAPSVALAVVAGLGIGAINAFVVVGLRIESLIATLATGSLIQAFTIMITKSTAINDAKLTQGFADIGQTYVWGVGLPVLYALVVALAIWWLLDHTATGRRIYATGFNGDAARLAGVATDRLRIGSLLVSGLVAGIAGVVLASRIGTGSPTAGNAYLLPAFAGVFLGATQFKRGRFNAPGTILAVVLLGTGVTGLGIVDAPEWSGSMFTGVVLIAALAVTGAQRRQIRRARRSRRAPVGRPPSDAVAAQRA